MRLFKKFSEQDGEISFAGSLLIAHPSLVEGYFNHTVILLMVHSVEEGSLGLVLNHPLDQKLEDYDEKFAGTELALVPLFDGGPVSRDQLIFVAWKQAAKGMIQLYFGIDESKAREIISNDPEFELRGFCGYSGWSEGQLEEELEMNLWVLTQLSTQLSDLDNPKIWQTLLASEGPEMRLLAGEPEDLSLN